MLPHGLLCRQWLHYWIVGERVSLQVTSIILKLEIVYHILSNADKCSNRNFNRGHGWNGHGMFHSKWIFTAALFIKIKGWEWARWPSWVSGTMVEYPSHGTFLRSNLDLSTTWTNFKGLCWVRGSILKKITYCMFPLTVF